METDAPNFSGNYPLGGERIGPAWRALWRSLDTETWRDGAMLAYSLAEETGLAPATLKGLLAKARAAGILVVSYRKPAVQRRATAHYRVLGR